MVAFRLPAINCTSAIRIALGTPAVGIVRGPVRASILPPYIWIMNGNARIEQNIPKTRHPRLNEYVF
jgi:hypothetical protein